MADSNEQLRAIVTGRVQGVNFRYYTRERAVRLGLTGWVRNRADGSVEVLAEGPRPKLDQLLDFLRRGPAAARVEAVSSEWGPAVGELGPFDVRW